MKTTRGIEFDLEVTKVDHQSIDVLATCEEGDKVFTIDFPYPIQEDDTFYGELLEGDTSQIPKEDLSEVMAWVDEVTIAFLVSEVTKLCLAKSNDNELWCFSMHTLNTILISLHCHSVEDGLLTGETLFSEFAHTEQEVKDLLNKLK